MKEKGKMGAKQAQGEGFRRSNRAKGGFLDDKVAEITDATCIHKTQERNDGSGDFEANTLQITYDVEGMDRPVERNYSMGKTSVPYENGEMVDEGQFVGGADPSKPWKGLHEACAASYYLDKLADLGAYDEDTLVNDGVRAALVGIKGVLNEFQPPLKKNVKKGFETRPFPVFTSIESKAGGTSAGKKAAPVKAAGGKPNGPIAAAVEDDTIEDDGEQGLEATVTALVVKLSKKGPITKTRMSQAIGKAFEGDDNKMAAVSLAIKDSFLRGLVADGDIAYDGKEIGPA